MKSAPKVISQKRLHGGSSRGGYQIDVHNGLLHMSCWGVWDREVAHVYKEQLCQVMQSLKANGGPWAFCSDFSKFPPQGGEVAKIQGELMVEAMDCGMSAAATIVTSAMTRLQIQRIAEENGLHGLHFFEDEKSAHAWLSKASRPSSN